MPIPDERLPEFDESDEVESVADREMLDEELEFESADADTSDDDMLDPEEADAGFGYGDPAD